MGSSGSNIRECLLKEVMEEADRLTRGEGRFFF